MAGESYTTKKILLKAVDGTTTQYFIPYVNNATADKTGLVKPDGTTITVDANGTISAQVDISGLQSKIDADHKLSADLISDGTTNKVVTATEKSTWNGKQDLISDLSTIRANATAGAEAASTIAGYGDIVTHDADEFLTEHQDISGKQDKITSTNKLSADLISEGTTNKLVSASEKSAWSNKQDAILDLNTIRSNATAGAGAASTIAGYGDVVTHDADEFAEATHTHTKSQITDFPVIPTVNDAEIEIQKNGTKVGSFTTNQGGSKKTINITVPTSATDVSALPASTKYGSTIDLTVDPDTYVVTATLKDQDGTALSSDIIDLPLESVVVSGSYDNTNKKVILTLQSGSTVEFSVADLVSGLQTEITSTNKLSADLIKDGTTNKTVTATEKSTWNSKQDAINDLSTIRSNAEAGAGAATTIAGYGDIVAHNADEFAESEHIHAISDITNLQTTLDGKQATISDLSTIRTNATAGSNAASTIAGYGDIVTHDASEFLTEHQDISGKQDKITSTNKLDADLISDGTTNKVVTATEKATWNAKQEAISDISTIRSNAEAGAEAASTISGYGDIVTHNADEFLTEHQDISGKQDKIDDLATIRSGASAGATAVQPDDLATVATSGSYNDLTDKPTIPTVNNATITIQKNGTKVDSFTANQSTAKTINITVPTTAADVSALPSSTKYAASMTLSINSDTYVITAQLKDQSGNALGTAQTIDLPLESVVVNGSYDKTNKKIVLTLQSGSTVDVPVGDLIAGLQTQITSTNKLSADLIADGTTNKVVTATEKNTWNNKQAAISDLATIRSGASAGATAVQPDDLATVATSGSYADLTNKPTVDSALSSTSTNAIQNKVVNAALNNYIPKSFNTANIPGSSTAPTALQRYGNARNNSFLTNVNLMHLGVNKLFRCYERGATITCNYDTVIANLGKTMCDGSVSGHYPAINPSTAFASKPFVWEVTQSSPFEQSDVLCLEIFGHRLTDSCNCTAYKLETYVYNDNTSAKEWVTVINYSGAAVNIAQTGFGLFKSGHSSNGYYPIHGIRLTISGSTETVFKIAEIALMATRGTEQPYQALHCVPDFGGTITGNLTVTGSINGTVSKATADASGNTITTTYATKTELAGKANATHTHASGDITGLAKVATSGSYTDLTNKPTIPSAVTEATVSGWGFTKNTGTITGIKMNGASKGTSGVVDLGTVITTAGTGLSLSGTTLNHASSITAGTAGTSSATSGATLAVPYVTYNASGHVTAAGTHTHTITGFAATSHNQASNTINALTGYTKAKASAAIATTDSLNTAVGKLEYKIDDVDTQLQALTAMLNAAS